IKNGSYNLILEVYGEDNFIFDLSGGAFSSRKLRKASSEVRKTAIRESIVVGLLPYKEDDKSIRLLFNREKKRKHFEDMDKEELMSKTVESYNRLKIYLTKHSNYLIYTGRRAPESIVNEVEEILKNER